MGSRPGPMLGTMAYRAISAILAFCFLGNLALAQEGETYEPETARPAAPRA